MHSKPAFFIPLELTKPFTSKVELVSQPHKDAKRIFKSRFYVQSFTSRHFIAIPITLKCTNETNFRRTKSLISQDHTTCRRGFLKHLKNVFISLVLIHLPPSLNDDISACTMNGNFVQDDTDVHGRNPVKKYLQKSFAKAMNDEMEGYESYVADKKRALFKKILPQTGSLLEIGIGTAPNLVYYPVALNIMGVEPNPFMNKYAFEKLKNQPLDRNLRIVNTDIESLEIAFSDSGQFDAVVCTLTLCSVKNVSRVLDRIVQLLKPGGVFIFFEHVIAPQGTLLWWAQQTLNPLQRLFADGCNLNRDIETLIRAQKGFSHVEFERFTIDRFDSVLISPTIMGYGIKSADL